MASPRPGNGSRTTGAAAGCCRQMASFPGASECALREQRRLSVAGVPRIPRRQAVVGGIRVLRDGAGRRARVPAVGQPCRLRPRCLPASGQPARSVSPIPMSRSRPPATCCASSAAPVRVVGYAGLKTFLDGAAGSGLAMHCDVVVAANPGGDGTALSGRRQRAAGRHHAHAQPQSQRHAVGAAARQQRRLHARPTRPPAASTARTGRRCSSSGRWRHCAVQPCFRRLRPVRPTAASTACVGAIRRVPRCTVRAAAAIRRAADPGAVVRTSRACACGLDFARGSICTPSTALQWMQL